MKFHKVFIRFLFPFLLLACAVGFMMVLIGEKKEKKK